MEQFDVIVASDVLLCCCGAPEALPAVLSRRLKLDGKALLLNALRGARAQLLLGDNVFWKCRIGSATLAMLFPRLAIFRRCC